MDIEAKRQEIEAIIVVELIKLMMRKGQFLRTDDPDIQVTKGEILQHLNDYVVIPVDKELPSEENNMGDMDAKQAKAFFNAVRAELDLGDFGFGITPASPSICLGDKILICKKDLHYPWFTKQMILHEIAHHLVPEDTSHGTRFHRKFAELVSRFLAGFTATEKLIGGE